MVVVSVFIRKWGAYQLIERKVIEINFFEIVG